LSHSVKYFVHDFNGTHIFPDAFCRVQAFFKYLFFVKGKYLHLNRCLFLSQNNLFLKDKLFVRQTHSFTSDSFRHNNEKNIFPQKNTCEEKWIVYLRIFFFQNAG